MTYRGNTEMNEQVGIHDYEYFACKVINKKGMNSKYLKMIENEITNQDAISSMHVVKMRKAIEGIDKFFIFMEYCNGGNL